jgi:two-component system chemotaxis response regulator CheY
VTVPRRARVLVVDDDESIRRLIELALTQEGYEVVTAAEGRAALAEAARQPPRLILLDIRMPVLDGWGFARAYRAGPPPHAPIVVLTAARDAAEAAVRIGAEACLAKPFELSALYATVARVAAPGAQPGEAPRE